MICKKCFLQLFLSFFTLFYWIKDTHVTCMDQCLLGVKPKNFFGYGFLGVKTQKS